MSSSYSQFWIFQTYLMPPESKEEAKCLLTVAKAGREACRVEMLLAEKKIQEALTLLQLYRVRALRSRKQLTDAEVDVGRARLAIRRSRYHVASLPMNLGEGDNHILHWFSSLTSSVHRFSAPSQTSYSQLPHRIGLGPTSVLTVLSVFL